MWSENTAFLPAAFPAIAGAAAEGDTRVQARSRGHLLGYAAGLREAEAEFSRRSADLERQAVEDAARRAADAAAASVIIAQAAMALRTAVVPVLDEARAGLLSAALELAQAIVGRELTEPTTALAAAIERAFSDTAADLVIDVHLNPLDADLAASLALVPDGVSIVSDAVVERGDAIATLPDGFIDAGIRSAVERARACLAEGADR
jgi:flagellar assembly protein FliH